MSVQQKVRSWGSTPWHPGKGLAGFACHPTQWAPGLNRLSTDLIIEQVLMRSMKTSGGLTRGREMRWCKNSQGWITTHGSKTKTWQARQDRDWKDILTVLNHLKERNSFSSDQSLSNITTGVYAHRAVNVDTTKSDAMTILQSMDAKKKNSCRIHFQEEGSSHSYSRDWLLPQNIWVPWTRIQVWIVQLPICSVWIAHAASRATKSLSWLMLSCS